MRFKLTLLIFFAPIFLMSQERVSVEYKGAPLGQVFNDIEKNFNIKLSFNSDVVNDQFITFKLDDATLDEIFLAIETQVNISFSKESERYYIIKKLPNSDLTSTQLLQEVVIKEYLTLGINRQNEDTSIKVSPKKMGILPGLTEPDVLQTIQLLPGVQSPTETASGIYIRGGTPDQNLVLWDGIKMYYSGHFFGTISAFNPYITKEVKLYKSGMKARYGDRISGVIDITSDSDIPNKIEGGFGSNMTHADAYLRAPIGKSTAIIVSARRSINDIVDSKTFRNYSKRVFQDTKISEGNKIVEDDEVTYTKDNFYFTDFTIKAISKLNDNNEISISSLFTKNKLDYSYEVEKFGELSGDQLDIKNHGTNLNWKHDFSNSLSHSASMYYSNFDLKYIGSNSIPDDEYSSESIKNNKIDDFGFSYDMEWSKNDKSILGFGYQFSSSKVKYEFSSVDSDSPEENVYQSNNNVNNIHTIYADYKLKTSGKWFIDLGLRTNYFSVVDKVFIEPRFQFQYNIGSNFKYKASAERLHQAVSQVVEFNPTYFGLEYQIWVISDGNAIPVLKSFQATSGFTFYNNGWDIDLEGFYKKVNGLTSFTLDFDNIDNFFSTGKSNVLGLELFIKKKIKNYRTWISYALNNNDFTFVQINNGDSFSGNSDITHQFTWSHTYEWKGFDVSIGWNWRTGIPYTNATEVIYNTGVPTIIYGNINGDRLPNYHRLDMSATYKFNISKNERWKGKLGFSILNIYNQKNVLSRTYKTRQPDLNSEYVLTEINKISIGTTPNFVFRVDF